MTASESTMLSFASQIGGSRGSSRARRYVLHHVPGFEQMHDAHHADPLASVGAPIWVTLPMLCLGGLFLLWWPVGLLQASGLTTGLALGYLWYITVHHASHRWHPDHRSYFYRRKRC